MDLFGFGAVFENELLGAPESDTDFLGPWVWELPQEAWDIEPLMASPVISGIGEELATGVDPMIEDPVLWTESDLNGSFELVELAPQTVDYTTTIVPVNEPQLPLQVSMEVEVGPATSVKKKKSPGKPTVNLYQMNENEAETPEMKRKIKKAKSSKAYNDRMKMYANLDPQLVQKVRAVASELEPYIQGMNSDVDIRKDPFVVMKMQELREIKDKLFSPMKKK